ncbi:MAG: TonB-dependent receptor domain-containing protein [Gammaproteobacteria bacterium]
MKYQLAKLSHEAAFQLAVRAAILTGLSLAGVAGAQEASSDATELEAIEVTGTRIVAPGIVSSSPVFSIERDEIDLQQQPEIERVFRLLPITVPADGQNVNNGTAGAATVNLRGLGTARSLILIDGKRLTPFNVAGVVDTQMIPVSLIERVDLITGGASAVYGSDAMSGAINVITRRDFEGVEFIYNNSITAESDGQQKSSSLVLGGNFGEGRGNAVLSINWVDRTGVQLGQRSLGQLGIVTTATTGGGYQEFLSGQAPPFSAGTCAAPNAVTAGGSSTTMPTRVSIAGSNAFTLAGTQQFRNDGTLGANCSVFNFNPYNYYQTPQERFGGTVVGHFDVMKNLGAYSRISYGVTNVTQQIAPSGIFGTTFWTPMTNTQISAASRTAMINAAEAGRVAGTVVTGGALPNWRDEDASGTVTAADDLLISYRRRTEELGPRSTGFENNNFQFVIGGKLQVFDTWNFDLSFARGQADRTQFFAGYTNVANIAQMIESEDGASCAPGAGPTCVPINLFGGFGTVSPQMADYARAGSLISESYEQNITSAVVSGLLPLELPSSARAIALSLGIERRREDGVFEPDECQKLAPASCLGGAGGNALPIHGGFSATEMFGETFIPLVDDALLVKSLDVELGYRASDYSSAGSNNTWKAGLTWAATDALLVRVMQQRAVRAPNVGELAAPQVAALNNAAGDPCSVGNASNNGPGTTLNARCQATGMTAAQVGTVQDIVSGQINTFGGTDPADLPSPEKGDSFTIGMVFTPKLGESFRDFYVTLDYYDIEINDYIDTYSAQEILDACYAGGQAAQCAKIVRVGGDLVLPGSGVELFTTNLEYRKAEGIEVGAGIGFGLGQLGGLKVMAALNKYLTQEFRSDPSLALNDCLGYFSTTCGGPRPEIRWIQRTTWDFNQFQASLLWRHLGSVSMHPDQVAALTTDDDDGSGTFNPGAGQDEPPHPDFVNIDAYDYFDLSLAYKVLPNVRLSATINNLFEKDQPVVGNEAADTGSNSGNTFPSHYDTVGRVYIFGVSATF